MRRVRDGRPSGAQAGGGGGGVHVIQAEQRRAGHRRDVDHADLGSRGRLGELPGDAGNQQRVPRGDDAAAQHHGSGQPRKAQPAHRGGRHDRDLAGQALHDLPGHGVALVGRAQQYGGQADQVVVRNLALVDADRHLLDPLHAEVAGQVARQRCLRAAAVFRADRVPEHLEAQPAAAAPVARDGAESQVPGDPAVRRHADGVDARAADHRDAPVRLSPVDQARTQDGEGVVDHGGAVAPPLRLHRRGVLRLLFRQVGVGQAGYGVPGQRVRGASSTAVQLRRGLLDHRVQDQHRLVDTDLVRVDAGAAGGGEQSTVGGDQGHVGLAVASVDGQHRRPERPRLVSQGQPRPGRTPSGNWRCSRRRVRPRARRPRCPRRRRPWC